MNPLERLRVAMAEKGLTSFLFTDIANVAWVTGFTGSNGAALVTQREAIFLTDSRYTIQAADQVKNMPSASSSSPMKWEDFLSGKVRELGVDRLAFESETVTYSFFDKLTKALSGVELIPGPNLIGKLRMVKSKDEIEKIRFACGFADATFEYLRPRIQVGRSEYDVGLELEFQIRRAGYELAFEPIVVSGVRSARPHGHASEKLIENGDFVTLDFGANVDGYNSDLTRTVVAGKATDRHREVYEQVLKAELAAIEAMKPGVLAKHVDARARQVLAEKDLARFFGHGLGHGLGRIVHDAGRMSATSEDVLEVGQVWTVEPGVYIEGFGGVRIEDDLVIREHGAECLTHAPKDLIELP